MLNLLQRTLAYIEEQNAWLSYLQSTIAEKERDYKTLHSMITKEITKEVEKRNVEAEDDDKVEDEVVVKMEYPDNEAFTDIQTTTEIQNDAGDDDVNSNSLLLDCNNLSETSACTNDNGTGHILDQHENNHELEHIETNHAYQVDNTQDHNKIIFDNHTSSDNMTARHKSNIADNIQRKSVTDAVYSDGTIPSYNYLNHSKSPTKLHALRHKCTHCKKSFSLLSSLKRHLRNHNGEKPYKCVYCEKTFYRSDLRKLHMRVHTGEKPYKCTYCDMAFSHASNRNMHLLTHTTS